MSRLKSTLARLKNMDQSLDISGITRGIEKENLRVNQFGGIAQTDHPAALGATLTHPFITTDFSEALPELITPPISGSLSMLEQSLSNIHIFFTQNMAPDELLWPSSMPGLIKSDQDIRIAEYGDSNVGKMKHIYRVGLSHRYGRMMQTVAGIHYNFSLPDHFFKVLQSLDQSNSSLSSYKSEKYMGLVRNFYRCYWLLPYLFGASPACMANSVSGEVPDYLSAWKGGSYIGEYATSLRMSKLGYQSDTQSDLKICYNTVANYARTLWQATHTPYRSFSDIGVQVDDQWRQLNDSILQIENEFYSPIRPKQPIHCGEMPSVALHCRGVEYIELRCIDLNPLLPLNIDIETMAFLDVFLVMCLLTDHQAMPYQECAEMRANFAKVVEKGRDPDLKLFQSNQSYDFLTMAEQTFECLQAVAEWMDECDPDQTDYQQSVARQYAKLSDVSLTPSHQIVEQMRIRNIGYAELILDLAKRHTDQSRVQTLPDNIQHEFHLAAQQSRQKKQQMEAEDQLPFDQYLAHYFKQAEQCFRHCHSVKDAI